MRKIFLSALFAVFSVAMMAVPAKRGVWKTVKLENGQEVRVELRGDEYGSFWKAADGRCFVPKTGTEYFEKADIAKIQKMAMEAREANPLPRHTQTAVTANGQRVGIGDSHQPFVGEKKGLIILAEFTDMAFQPGHDAEYYTHLANDVDFTSPDGHVGSIRDYFYAQSEGQFTLTFDVVGPVKLAHDMEYYGGHSTWGGNDKNVSAMIRECVNAAAEQLGSFADYDWFGDGNVDQVFVIYAGRGEADGGDENTIWPHRSGINSVQKGGKWVSVYACSNEMQSDTKVDGIGAFCHEFSHCLGLPDLYDTSYSDNYIMSYWDIMELGCYCGSSFRPCSYSGYERNYCGWKQPVVLTEDTEVSGVKGISEGGDYYIIYNDAYTNEYYILENRSRTGWDAAQYGAGLLITHIDFNKSLWASNSVNTLGGNNDHQRYAPFLADNNETLSAGGIGGDVYPNKSNNMLTDYSVPAATLYHANSDGQMLMNKPVTKITRADDGTISFVFKNEVGVKDDEPMPEGCIFRETFKNSSGLGGNDGVWSGNGVAVGTFMADNDGWTSAQKYGADQCARFGTNTQRGSVVTPEIELDGKYQYEMSFLLAPWTGEASTVALTVNSGTATLSETEFALEAGTWNECKTTIVGEGKVKIQLRSNKARFFLDEVFVNNAGEVSAIQSINSNKVSDSKIFTIDGRFAGTDVNALRRGIYIINGKKFVK